MLVEQAVFTSARTQRHQGYQLVARSPSLLDGLADFLAKWGPTHGSLLSDNVRAESINFTSIDRDWLALSRTLYGGPEYSARGALQIVTRFLIVRRIQLIGYDNNPIALMRTAKLMGQLWLTPSIKSKNLPVVDLPECVPTHLLADSTTVLNDTFVNRSIEAVRGQRLAIVGAANPISTMDQIVRRTPRDERLELSFTTGLVPSQHRQFRIHILHELDAAMHDRLSHQGIRFLAATV